MDAVASEPRRVVQFLQNVFGPSLRRVTAQRPCEVRLAFFDDLVECFSRLHIPVERLDLSVKSVARRIVVETR